MSDIQATIERLRELDRAADQAPWSLRRTKFYNVPDQKQYLVIGNDILSIAKMIGTEGYAIQYIPNAALIVELRNALPALLDALEQAERRAEAAEGERDAAVGALKSIRLRSNVSEDEGWRKCYLRLTNIYKVVENAFDRIAAIQKARTP